MVICILSFLLIMTIVSNVINTVSWRRERRDLLNRIMSKDIEEYKRFNEKEEPKEKTRIETGHERAIAEFRMKGRNSI